MQRISLLGLGFDRSMLTTVALDPAQLTPTPAPAPTGPAPGECRLDANGNPAYIWTIDPTSGVGFWSRLRAGQSCVTTGSGTAPTTRDQRGDAGGGGGVLVQDPFGNTVRTTVMPPPLIDLSNATIRDGRTQMVQVGPFQFSADLKTSTYWWSPSRGKLPADIQDYIKHAFAADDPTNSLTYKMSSQIGQYFDAPPPTYNASFVGFISPNTSEPWKTKPAWTPVLRTKHPKTGEDYGVFMATLYENKDLTPTDPAQKVALYFVWAPIQKAWYERLWDWIVEIVSKIVDYVCNKLSDPTTAALVTAGAAAAGAAYGVPPSVTAGAVGGVTLLCNPPGPTTPIPETQAIAPKPVWPYYLAGGIALFGLVAFLLTPPKKKPA